MPGVDISVDLNQAIGWLNRQFNDQRIDRSKATVAIVNHLREVFPAYNVMVVHSPHLQNFQEMTKSHIEVPTSIFSTIGYEVYVFKRGLFTLLGDGGYLNWAFNGNFQRDNKTVRFYDI